MKILFFIYLIFFQACTSYDKYVYLEEELEIPSQIFEANFTDTWSAMVGIMKKYDIELQNQETGVIKTRWMDNTQEINFSDSFGSDDKIKSARFKILLNAVESSRGSKQYTKVSVFKRQLIEQDFLHGWKELKRNRSLEKIILYRIGRLIKINYYLQKIQEKREKEELEQAL